jgi:cysteine-rich repeat protein
VSSTSNTSGANGLSATATLGGGVTAGATNGGGETTASGGTTGVGTVPPAGGSSSCGNGFFDATEECDDGNTDPGDGCNQQCRLEYVDPCLGGHCTLTQICGNAQLEQAELCDDGNLYTGDGCSYDCTLEPGYVCRVPGTPCELLVIPPGCGDGVIDSVSGETCDDGQHNGQSGYCPTNCGLVGTCGNSITEPWSGEQCDDGVNDDSYDGCRPNCRRAAYCGDGVANGPEQCDFGSQNSPLSAPVYGGCLVGCKFGPHCGDGVLQPPEDCDLGENNGAPLYLCSEQCGPYDIF